MNIQAHFRCIDFEILVARTHNYGMGSMRLNMAVKDYKALVNDVQFPVKRTADKKTESALLRRVRAKATRAKTADELSLIVEQGIELTNRLD